VTAPPVTPHRLRALPMRVSPSSLVAFRALQGVAAGLITPLVQTMLVRAAGREKLGRVLTIVTIVTLFPPIVGPVVAGLILANGSWRWIFYVNVPICLAAVILAWVFLPRPAGRRSQDQPGHRLDVTGVLLLSPALVAILYGLSRAAGGQGFAGADAYGPPTIGAVLAVGYPASACARWARCPTSSPARRPARCSSVAPSWYAAPA
jgi:MFS family permease